MSSSSLKLLAALFVALGVGICATFGAQLTPKTLHAVSHKIAPSTKVIPSKVEAPLDRVYVWWSLSSFPFCGGLFLILLGSGFARTAQSSAMKKLSSIDSGQNILELETGLELIINELKILQELMQAKQSESHLDTIKKRIETLQANVLEPLVDQRDRFRMKLGTKLFVEVFGPFSQGERRINRAWAACVDQHHHEVNKCLQLANASFQQALQTNSITL